MNIRLLSIYVLYPSLSPISTKILIGRESAERQFLGAFAKLRKAIIRFVMSARPYGTTRLPLDGFS